MFTIPVIRSDHSSYENSGKKILKRRLKKIEIDSIRSDFQLSRTKLVIPRNSDENSDFVGLLTGDTYKADELEKETTTSDEIHEESQVTSNDSPSEEEYLASDNDDPTDSNDEKNRKERIKNDSENLQLFEKPGSFFHRRSYDMYTHGLEELPRPVSPMRIVKDSPLTTAMVYEKRGSLSSRVRQAVSQKGLRDKTGSFVVTNDDKTASADTWSSTMSLRIRHIYIINTLMHLSLLRGDYSTALKAFSLMIRLPMVDLRLIWTVGLELLVWKRERREAGLKPINEFTTSEEIPNNNDVHTAEYAPGSKTEDEDFLQWLIINHPYYKKLDKEITNIRSRADEFNSHFIFTKLRHENPEIALDRLQEILLETPYSEDPMYYMLGGIAVIQLACKEKATGNDEHKLEELSEKARDYFEKCLKYGGVFPSDFVDLEIEAITKPSNVDSPETASPYAQSPLDEDIQSPFSEDDPTPKKMSPELFEPPDDELQLEFDFSDQDTA